MRNNDTGPMSKKCQKGWTILKVSQSDRWDSFKSKSQRARLGTQVGQPKSKNTAGLMGQTGYLT